MEKLGVTRHNFRLENGMLCVLFERPNMPLHLQTVFKAGSRYNPPGKEGLAHLTEHMLLAGTKQFPSGTDLGAYIEQYGGWYNAHTPQEEIMIDVSVGDPVDAEIAFNMMGGMLNDSLFEPDTIGSERESVLGEIGEWEANPAKQIWDVTNQLFFQNTVLGRQGVGSVEAIKAISRDELLDYYHQLLTADRGALVMAGGISKPRAAELAQRYLGNLRVSKQRFEDGLLPELRRRPVLIIKKPNHQIQASFGFRTCTIDHADAAAIEVIAAALGRGGSSRLQHRLRQQLGLVYSVWTDNVYLAAGGFMTVKTTADKAKLPAVLEAIVGEFRAVYEGQLTSADIALAKAKLVKSTHMYLQTSWAWVDSHARNILQTNEDWDVFKYDQSLEAVSPEDIARVGRKYFQPGSWYLGLIGDVRESDILIEF